MQAFCRIKLTSGPSKHGAAAIIVAKQHFVSGCDGGADRGQLGVLLLKRASQLFVLIKAVESVVRGGARAASACSCVGGG